MTAVPAAVPPEPTERPELAGLLELAVRAARAGAAEVAARIATAAPAGVKSTPTDVVTDADRAADAAVRAVLAAARPGDGVLSEESAETASRTGYRWVLDPLDGTVNYVHGIGHFAVSVACERDTGRGWEPLAGAVHDVVRDETFTARRGGGAYLAGRRLRVREPAGLGTALVATGFAYAAPSRARQGGVLRRALPAVGDIRSTGSHALDLCWTAAGRFDGCFEDEVSRWDWAAGALIVREAGGVVTPYGAGVLAAGPVTHRALLELLAHHDLETP